MKQAATRILFAACIAYCMLGIATTYAASAGGGGMPYSNGLNTFKTSVTGEVAGIIAVIGVVAGVAAYLYQGVLDPLLMKIVQVVIAVCIIGGVTTFLTTMGVTGAVVH
ncbi:MAG TPA: TrbC/VirB2 family protein [Ktedonobacterales bacterium]|nr:TrbC/VirB2 family protein [Ktedonobacterales bacterium]